MCCILLGYYVFSNVILWHVKIQICINNHIQMRKKKCLYVFTGAEMRPDLL